LKRERLPGFFPETVPDLSAFPVFWQFPKQFPVLFFVSKETIVYYRSAKKYPSIAYIYQVFIREAPITGRLYHAGTSGQDNG
jgi:hypothetical protein